MPYKSCATRLLLLNFQGLRPHQFSNQIDAAAVASSFDLLLNHSVADRSS